MHAQEVLDGWATAMLQGDVGTMPVPWFDYIEFLLLHREASELVTGKPFKPDPRWITIQDRAWAATR
jgi:hypothetical protein